MDHQSRLDAHLVVSAELDQLSDEQLRRRLASAAPQSGGIGGSTTLLDVGGQRVFVKRLSVTELERHPDNLGNTANLFGLPTHCHYGVGAPTTGAWRELRVHEQTTGWTLNGACDAFPLMYHWRLLSRDSPATLDCAQHGDLETWVHFWHGSEAVRRRLQALDNAPAELLLFLEYVPHNLLEYLTGTSALGADALDVVLTRVEAQLIHCAVFMATNGLAHFDAHLLNILADDTRLYLTDFGLAASRSFVLTTNEATFLQEHLEHDVAYVLTQLVNWIATQLTMAARTWTHPRERNEYIRRCADGYEPPELLPAAAAIVKRHAPVATVINDFYFALHGTSRLTAYPCYAVREACAASGISLAASE